MNCEDCKTELIYMKSIYGGWGVNYLCERCKQKYQYLAPDMGQQASIGKCDEWLVEKRRITDTERLDFIERSGKDLFYTNGLGFWMGMLMNDDGIIYFKTPREAIDAAILEGEK